MKSEQVCNKAFNFHTFITIYRLITFILHKRTYHNAAETDPFVSI